jgi:plasmid stabilization system protein ParE
LNRPVPITAIAEADIAKAQDYYESRETGLGNRFVKHVRDTIARIAQNPFTYQIAIESARRARVADFPYGVSYRVLPDESIVIACLSYRQEPGVAKTRALKPEPSP